MSLRLSTRLCFGRRGLPIMISQRFGRRQPPSSSIRPFSAVTENSASGLKNVLETESTIATTNARPAPIQDVVRHSEEDRVITLNVGGKEFVTLRSTVFLNPVLRDCCLRAEANSNFKHGGDAIFVDRDPAQFGLILQHLRNEACGFHEVRVECESASQAHTKLKLWIQQARNRTQIQIPEKIGPLKDLFLEARHYQIKELEDLLCGQSLYLRLASIFGGSSKNPFQPLTDAAKMLRRGLVATGGVGMYMGSQNDDVHAIMGNCMRVLKGEPKQTQAKGSGAQQSSDGPVLA